jgi:hypothetical protein
MKKLLSLLAIFGTTVAIAQVNRTYYDEIYLGDFESFPDKKVRYSTKRAQEQISFEDDYYENRIRRFHRGFGFGYSTIGSLYYDPFYFNSYHNSPFVHSSFYSPYFYNHHHCAYYPDYHSQVVVVGNFSYNGFKGTDIRSNPNASSGTNSGSGSARPNGQIIQNHRGGPRGRQTSVNTINSRVLNSRSGTSSVVRNVSTIERPTVNGSFTSMRDMTRQNTFSRANATTRAISNSPFSRSNTSTRTFTQSRSNRGTFSRGNSSIRPSVRPSSSRPTMRSNTFSRPSSSSRPSGSFSRGSSRIR